MKSFDWLVPLLLFAFYVAASCSGLLLLKVAPEWLSAPFLAGAFLYLLGAAIWVLILRAYPLSVAFPVAAGALMVGTVLIGGLFLREDITAQQILGTGLIFAGIVLVVQKAAH